MCVCTKYVYTHAYIQIHSVLMKSVTIIIIEYSNFFFKCGDSSILFSRGEEQVLIINSPKILYGNKGLMAYHATERSFNYLYNIAILFIF